MPFTPFHFGPGLALKALARPVFSWSTFALTQVVIDCETLVHLVHGEYPIHRVLHTFVGATAAGLATAGLWLGFVRATAAALPTLMASLRHSTSPVRSELSVAGAILGGVLGGASHPFLDGIMHPDVRPFMPFSDANPFLGWMGVGALHAACALAGLLGLVGLLLGRVRAARHGSARIGGGRQPSNSPVD